MVNLYKFQVVQLFGTIIQNYLIRVRFLPNKKQNHIILSSDLLDCFMLFYIRALQIIKLNHYFQISKLKITNMDLNILVSISFNRYLEL